MKLLLSICCLIFQLHAQASDDTLLIQLSKTSFHTKDTIEFSCTIPHYTEKKMATATLNLCIESLDDKKTWKYRYPVINGKATAALSIGDSIKPGRYALNFILQEGLFRIDGNLRNNYSYNKLNYLLLTQARESFFNDVALSPSGDFNIRNIIFQDEAYFIFTPGGKQRSNDLFITMASPLDSLFQPLAVFTQIIDVNATPATTSTSNTAYHFDFNKFYRNTTLPDVTVRAKASTRLQEYEKEFTTALFGNASRTFDGMDDRAIANSINIGIFLQTRIPGFRVDNQGRWLWRNQDVSLFVDEYKVDETDLVYIHNEDIAMIKFYAAPAAMVEGQGPAVAIYTKKGADENNKTRRYRFKLKGYTPIESSWN